MQPSIKRFFRKDSFLMWSIMIGSILWLTNAAFNFAAKDYSHIQNFIIYYSYRKSQRENKKMLAKVDPVFAEFLQFIEMFAVNLL